MAADFWSLLGGRTQYRGKRSHAFICSFNLCDLTASQWNIIKHGLYVIFFELLILHTGAGTPEEDEIYECGVVESNCVYRLVENRLVPHEQAWASTPSMSLLGSSEVSAFLFISVYSFLYFSHILKQTSVFTSSPLSHVCMSRSWCLISAVRCICGMDRTCPSGGEMLLFS